MGTINDPVTIYVTTYCVGAGVTQTDNFSVNTTLTNYATDIPTLATPLWTVIQADKSYAGGVRTATPVALGGAVQGFGAYTSVDLRAVIEVGIQTLATPQRPHITYQTVLSSFNVTGTQAIANWLTSSVARLIPQNLYTGVIY